MSAWVRVEVEAYPEEWYHLHGKAISGLRHSHPLQKCENREDPWHYHEGEDTLPHDHEPDRRGIGAAIYWGGEPHRCGPLCESDGGDAGGG